MDILRFLKPCKGDCLTNKAGILTDGGKSLTVTVRIAAPADAEIYVNGQKAVWREGVCVGTAVLSGYRNLLRAENRSAGVSEEIPVYWLPKATDCYRLSLDDNIWFLQNIAKHENEYQSIFEDPYLSMLRATHEKYGTKINANIYLEAPEFGGFSLKDFPEKYKSEWKKNADWLHLSFHARANLPDKPYQFTEPEVILKDYRDVMREIYRFAGEESVGAETTIHWGEATKESVRALRKEGVKLFAGYLCFYKDGNPLVSYYLNEEQINNSDRYGIWHDEEEDVTFSKIDVVLNEHSSEGNIAILNNEFRSHPDKGFWEFLIHEEYFYPHYERYIPDFGELVMNAAAWAEKKGLKPAFLTETHLG